MRPADTDLANPRANTPPESIKPIIHADHYEIGPWKFEKMLSDGCDWRPHELLEGLIHFRHRACATEWFSGRANPNNGIFIPYTPKPREGRMKIVGIAYAEHAACEVERADRIVQPELKCFWPATGFDPATGEVIFTEPT